MVFVDKLRACFCRNPQICITRVALRNPSRKPAVKHLSTILDDGSDWNVYRYCYEWFTRDSRTAGNLWKMNWTTFHVYWLRSWKSTFDWIYKREGNNLNRTALCNFNWKILYASCRGRKSCLAVADDQKLWQSDYCCRFFPPRHTQNWWWRQTLTRHHYGFNFD